MQETINTHFDPTALPEWAQNSRLVRDLCRRELSFRARVCEALTEQMQRVLFLEAQNRQRLAENS